MAHAAADATAFDELAPSWRRAFDEAWASFREGNFGIGAVLVDPGSGDVVSAGRNRVTERDPSPRTVGGNMMAHAEMNAFAALPRFLAEGLHLYTTLEPCLMCAATSIFLRVEHVHFAAVDEFFVGLDDLWSGHEYTERYRPGRTGPIDGRIAAFARLLPLAFTVLWSPDGDATRRARAASPDLVDLAAALTSSDDFREVVTTEDVGDAFAAIAPHLPV